MAKNKVHGMNEAVFIGGLSNQTVVAKKKPVAAKNTVAANQRKRMKETFHLLAPSADRLTLILREEIEKADSLTRLKSQLPPTATDANVATEMRANERYVHKLEQLIVIIDQAKKDEEKQDD